MAPTKKSKKDAQSISSKLALVLKSGKVTLGYVCYLDSPELGMNRPAFANLGC